MREVQDGSDWVIDGGKCWISNSLEAGVFVVFANADPSKGHRGPDKNDKTMFKGVEVHNGWAVVSESDSRTVSAAGITAFVVDKDNKGLQIGKKADKSDSKNMIHIC